MLGSSEFRAFFCSWLARLKLIFDSKDLILFKLIASRPKDILDIRSIILRHKKHLDTPYLRKWAQVISDDLGDVEIYTELEKLLGEE